jgi:hypothetical protein
MLLLLALAVWVQLILLQPLLQTVEIVYYLTLLLLAAATVAIELTIQALTVVLVAVETVDMLLLMVLEIHQSHHQAKETMVALLLAKQIITVAAAEVLRLLVEQGLLFAVLVVLELQTPYLVHP